MDISVYDRATPASWRHRITCQSPRRLLIDVGVPKVSSGAAWASRSTRAGPDRRSHADTPHLHWSLKFNSSIVQAGAAWRRVAWTRRSGPS